MVSSSDSLDEALGNVEQWSDLIVDHEAPPSSSRRSSQIPRSLSVHNEYVDEPSATPRTHQPFDADQLHSSPNISLLDEISVALDHLYPTTRPTSNETTTDQFQEPAEDTLTNGNHANHLALDDAGGNSAELVTSNINTPMDTSLSVAPSVEIPSTPPAEREIPSTTTSLEYQPQLTIHDHNEDIHSTVRAHSSVESSGTEEPLLPTQTIEEEVVSDEVSLKTLSEIESAEQNGQESPNIQVTLIDEKHEEEPSSLPNPISPYSLLLDGGVTYQSELPADNGVRSTSTHYEDFFDAVSRQETGDVYEPALDLIIAPVPVEKSESTADTLASSLLSINGTMREDTPVEQQIFVDDGTKLIDETPIENSERSMEVAQPAEECIDQLEIQMTNDQNDPHAAKQNISDSVTRSSEPTRPKFTLRLKPMLSVNNGDRLQLEVHFLAHPEPSVSDFPHACVDSSMCCPSPVRSLGTSRPAFSRHRPMYRSNTPVTTTCLVPS